MEYHYLQIRMPKLKSILYKVVNTIPVVKTSIMFSVEMGEKNFQNLYERVKNPKQTKAPLEPNTKNVRITSPDFRTQSSITETPKHITGLETDTWINGTRQRTQR